MTSLPPILFFTPDPPTALWQDKPQIARRLARLTPVLYVSEEPYLRPLLQALRRGQAPPLTQPKLTSLAPGLYRFSWSPLAPVTGAPLLGAVTAALRHRRLQSALRWLQSSDQLSVIGDRSPTAEHCSPRAAHRSPILWLFRPGRQEWIDRLRPSLVVYHVVDEYSAYPNLSPAQAERQRELDRRLTARADLVFCTAQSLVEARRPLNPHTYYLPNAVDFEAFRGARPSPLLAHLPPPILGVVGGINAKVDLALLAEAARRRPAWTVALVGPLGYGLDPEELAQLRSLPNVHFLGPVPPEDAPAVIAACDVGLIPYRLTEQTRHVNPLKAYEYLAVGKPVVGTALPELAQFGDLVHIAAGQWPEPGRPAGQTDAESFIAAVEAALAEADDPDRAARRQAFAAANTWDHRVARMVELLEAAIGER
ncbi:MAG: glycosyltransferase [Caldilineales bacterium]|nr:glycosyltransferase [Caldilineales bacterium]